MQKRHLNSFVNLMRFVIMRRKTGLSLNLITMNSLRRHMVLVPDGHSVLMVSVCVLLEILQNNIIGILK
jgi:hypothetical protein